MSIEQEGEPVEVTRADIDRLHVRLDESAKTMGELQVTLARIEERINLAPKPVTLPGRPCEFFLKHEEKHEREEEEKKKTIKEIIIEFAKPVITAAGVTAAMWFGLSQKHQ